MVNLTKGYSHTMAIMVAMDILQDSTLLLLGLTLPEHTLHNKVIRRMVTHLKATHQQDILLVLTHHLGILVHLLHIIQVNTQISPLILDNVRSTFKWSDPFAVLFRTWGHWVTHSWGCSCCSCIWCSPSQPWSSLSSWPPHASWEVQAPWKVQARQVWKAWETRQVWQAWDVRGEVQEMEMILFMFPYNHVRLCKC